MSSISRWYKGSWHMNCQLLGKRWTLCLAGCHSFQFNTESNGQIPIKLQGTQLPRNTIQTLPHCPGHFTTCHSHESPWARALLRGRARQGQAEQHCSSLPADFCRPELNQVALRGCVEGNKLVLYTDCFNSITFMYWKLKSECCF